MTTEDKRKAQTEAARRKSAETRTRRRLARAAREIHDRGLTIEELINEEEAA